MHKKNSHINMPRSQKLKKRDKNLKKDEDEMNRSFMEVFMPLTPLFGG